MVSYETAYREAYNEVVDYLVSLAQTMYDNDHPTKGDVEVAALDAVLDVWHAIHGMNSEVQNDELWMDTILNVARARIASI